MKISIHLPNFFKLYLISPKLGLVPFSLLYSQLNNICVGLQQAVETYSPILISWARTSSLFGRVSESQINKRVMPISDFLKVFSTLSSYLLWIWTKFLKNFIKVSKIFQKFPQNKNGGKEFLWSKWKTSCCSWQKKVENNLFFFFFFLKKGLLHLLIKTGSKSKEY